MIGNEILFSWRRLAPKLRRKPYSERPQTRLSQNIFPDSVAAALTEENLKQNLFVYQALEQMKLELSVASARVLDIGSKNFAYAPALSLWLSQKFQKFSLEGLEIDPFKYYGDLYRRVDCADYYMELAKQLSPASDFQFRAGDWLDESSERRWDIILCLYPFLFEDLHQGWGLPKRSFSPKKFYEKALAQADRFILFHQGEAEREESLKLLNSLGAHVLIDLPIQTHEPVRRKFRSFLIISRE